MTAATVWFIFAKELIDTLRDRRTLIFMLLIPVLAVPGLMLGLTRFVLHIQKKQAVKVVTVAADEETRRRYARIVHDWFLSTGVDAEPPETARRMLRPFLGMEDVGGGKAIGEEIFTDPEAFDQWLHEITGQAREIVSSLDLPRDFPTLDLPAALRERLFEFYRVTICGLGLIEFVDSSSLEPAPGGFELETLPERLRLLPEARDIAWAIKSKRIHGYLRIPDDIDELTVDDETTIEITLFHDSTVSLSREARGRFAYAIRKAGESLVGERLGGRDLQPEFVRPLAMAPATDLATPSQIALDAVGGILPYIVLIFAFMGALYPAIDLGAGEKERHTLETLLLAPSSRTEIALGKLLVIFATSMVAAFLGLLSMIVSLQHIVPPRLIERLNFQIEPSIVVFVCLLVIPLAVALSAVCLAISICARSFKEAQNYMAPLQFVVILPALAPLVPGLEMNWKLAFVPFVNVSMLAKEFLKGDANWGYYFAALVSSLALAAVCVSLGVRQFCREQVLFRT